MPLAPAVLLPLIQAHSLVVLGAEGGVLPPPPPPLLKLPPQPEASSAVETNNVKGIFPGNRIMATFQTSKSICAKYSAKANPIMDGWQGTFARRQASELGSYAGSGAGDR
jgi:hypothetical protein